jgi:hypothetical protein
MRPGRRRRGDFSQPAASRRRVRNNEATEDATSIHSSHFPRCPRSRHLLEIVILWSVLLFAGANSSRGKKVMRSGRHHVEVVNPPKHPDCGESSIDIHVLTTLGGLSDSMTASDAISKSLEIPVMICRIASQPGPVWRIRARPGHQTQDHSRGTRHCQCDPSTNMVTVFWSKRSPAVRRACT